MAEYENEENCTFSESLGVDYYIKHQTYEQQKKSSFKNNISRRENMLYDAQCDEYTGQQLKPVRLVNGESTTGYVSEVTVYECEDCEGCPHKSEI